MFCRYFYNTLFIYVDLFSPYILLFFSHYTASLVLFYFGCCMILWSVYFMLFMSENSFCSYCYSLTVSDIE